MKRTLILLAILFLLLGVYYFTKDKGKVDKTSIVIADREFVVENREDISYVTIKRKAYPLIHLARAGNDWLLNKNHKVEKNVIDNILSVLTRMRVNTVPSRSQLKKIKSNMVSHGIYVKTYDKKGKLLSDFIVGNDSSTDMGTYCLKNGAEQPYLMRVPAVSGGIRTYFLMDQMDMRDKTVYNFRSDNIKSVTIDYKKDRINSFKIEKQGGRYAIQPLLENNPIKLRQNQNILSAYIKDYNKLGAEHIHTGDPQADSLHQHLPFMQMKVELDDGGLETIDFYPAGQITERDKTFNTLRDLNGTLRYYAFTSDGDVYLVQHPLVNKHFKDLNYFNR